MLQSKSRREPTGDRSLQHAAAPPRVNKSQTTFLPPSSKTPAQHALGTSFPGSLQGVSTSVTQSLSQLGSLSELRNEECDKVFTICGVPKGEATLRQTGVECPGLTEGLILSRPDFPNPRGVICPSCWCLAATQRTGQHVAMSSTLKMNKCSHFSCDFGTNSVI